jgi:thiol-disulfide isomerase/thioredoxin
LKGKVVFINIWATWCAPCMREIPGIEKLWESLRDEPVAFLLITDEDEDRVRAYLQGAPHGFPVYLPAEKRELAKPFDNYGRPATFILDRAGRIVFRQTGAANWDQDFVRTYLRRLLKD